MTARRIMGAGAAFALLLAASAAVAQAPDVVRVRGTIQSVDGQMMSVTTRDGATINVKLADNGPVRTVVKASLADIKPGSYVAVTGVPQPDGSQKAVAILIFPEAMRGVAEGFSKWDLTPNSSMTNATVDSTVASVDGQILVLKYKDGEQKIVVPADAQIVTYAPATMADVKPGEKILVVAAKKQPDGTALAPNISIGDYGVWR